MWYIRRNSKANPFFKLARSSQWGGGMECLCVECRTSWPRSEIARDMRKGHSSNIVKGSEFVRETQMECKWGPPTSPRFPILPKLTFLGKVLLLSSWTGGGSCSKAGGNYDPGYERLNTGWEADGWCEKLNLEFPFSMMVDRMSVG